MTTVAQALGAAAAHLQDVEEGDIGAEYRVAMTPGGRSGQEVEIYLYDLTPGGAGFVRTALKDIDGLFASALERLEGCDCTHSCYECLRSYRNKFDHPYLDRHLAAAFLRHCVYGEAPQLDDTIEDRLLRALVVDLEESGCNVDRVRGGLRLTELENRTVVVGHSLTPGAAGTASGRSLHSEGGVVVDQLLIDRALPAAVLKATGPTTSVDELAVLPAFFKLAEIGLPIYTANSLEDGLEEAGAPLAHVETEGMPDGAFIVRLDSPTLDDLNSALRASGWAVFAPANDGDFQVRRTPQLLRMTTGGFNATSRRWTLGRAILRKDKVHILYHSRAVPSRSELHPTDRVKVVGNLLGLYVNGVYQPLAHGGR